MIDESIYNDLLQKVNFRNIELMNLEFGKLEQVKSPELEVNIDYEIEEINKDNRLMTLQYLISFNIKAKEVKTDSVEFFVKFTYRVTYDIKKQFSDEIYNSFGERNVPLNVWPYARELVSSATSRMAYPPLYIPVKP